MVKVPLIDSNTFYKLRRIGYFLSIPIIAAFAFLMNFLFVDYPVILFIAVGILLFGLTIAAIYISKKMATLLKNTYLEITPDEIRTVDKNGSVEILWLPSRSIPVNTD